MLKAYLSVAALGAAWWSIVGDALSAERGVASVYSYRGGKTATGEASQPGELTAAEMGKREKALAHLLIIAHEHGVPAAMEEWRRMLQEDRTKASSADPSLAKRATSEPRAK